MSCGYCRPDTKLPCLCCGSTEHHELAKLVLRYKTALLEIVDIHTSTGEDANDMREIAKTAISAK